jgi:two-component system, NarL family, response regulator NreC
MAIKPPRVRILVADDSATIRNSLCTVLQSQRGWTVCGEASDGQNAFDKAIELRPDVILVDLSMPCLNGFDVAARISEETPGAEILIVTEHDTRMLACLPAQPGVRGYVVKSRIERDLVPAVKAASEHRPLARFTTA